MTKEYIQAVHERYRREIFQFIPSQPQIKTMIEKAVAAYDKAQLKRKEAAKHELKKHHANSSEDA